MESNPDRAVLAIGPEGGWTPYELDKLQACGFKLFGMGKRILRTDTAAVALLAQLAGLVAGDGFG
jgi:RsmE family RNA methyltransferase